MVPRGPGERQMGGRSRRRNSPPVRSGVEKWKGGWGGFLQRGLGSDRWGPSRPSRAVLLFLTEFMVHGDGLSYFDLSRVRAPSYWRDPPRRSSWVVG